MNKKNIVNKRIIGFISIILCILFIGLNGFAAENNKYPVTPKLNHGHKWRIGYYEGGNYIEYKQTLTAIVKGLMDLNWIEKTDLPKFSGDGTQALWNWLSTKLKSKYLIFKKDAYYSSQWKNDIKEQQVKSLIKRLNKKKDIDLMIAMGTWAAQGLAHGKTRTPTIACAVSDAVSAGIIKDYKHSGYDYFHVRVDPLRYKRQVEIFYNIIKFKKLGVMYENTIRGRSYAGMDKIKAVAKKDGFEIVSCFLKQGVDDQKIAEKEVRQCFSRLCSKADAIYVTMHMGVDAATLPYLVKTANKAGIPTFSQAGSEEVKYGLLMSISQAGFKYVGEYQARIIAKVFNGAKPGQLNQLFEAPSRIAINLKTASTIGYDPPVDVLSAADEIYNNYKK